MKRRREVTIEIEREIVISHHQGQSAWCAFCGNQVQMLTAAEAAQVTGTDETRIIGDARSGRLHYRATEAGQLWICADSLIASHAVDHHLHANILQIAEGLRLSDDNLIDPPTT